MVDLVYFYYELAQFFSGDDSSKHLSIVSKKVLNELIGSLDVTFSQDIFSSRVINFCLARSFVICTYLGG